MLDEEEDQARDAPATLEEGGSVEEGTTSSEVKLEKVVFEVD